MISWILERLSKLPNILQGVFAGALVFILIVGLFLLTSQIRACGYDRAREQYEQTDKLNAAKVADLEADAKAKEAQIVALQTKVQFYEAAADAGRKVDNKLQDQVNEVANNAANQEVNASTPTDCHVRAKRVCALLRANNIPGDCAAIEREACGTAGQ